MKKSMFYHYGKKWVIVVAFFIVTFVQAQDLITKLSGQSVFDGLVASNMNTLNSHSDNFIWYFRSTIDYSIDLKWGNTETSIIHLYNSVSLRYL